jgi:hypothetical protein
VTTEPLRASPTWYGLTRFRSRLEAKWAIFYDAVGLRWIYEPEGYDLENTWYLIDFHFPDVNHWAEIKGTARGQIEQVIRKASLLAVHSRQPVLVFVGDEVKPTTGAMAFFSRERQPLYDGPVYWMQCPSCKRLGYGNTSQFSCLFCGERRRVSERKSIQMRHTPWLLNAYRQANDASNFERGRE